jgi:hypothetical protein
VGSFGQGHPRRELQPFGGGPGLTRKSSSIDMFVVLVVLVVLSNVSVPFNSISDIFWLAFPLTKGT